MSIKFHILVYNINFMDKNQIITKLNKEGKSDSQIAKEIGYKSGESVRLIRLKLGLPSNGRKCLESFNREDSEKLFKNGKNYKEIAKILNVNQNTLNSYFIRKYGILPSEKRQSKSIKLTQNQKETLFGTLLGDGNLRMFKKGKNASGKIEHCEKQLEFIKFKHKILENLSADIYLSNRIDNRFINSNYIAYSFRINTNPDLNIFYNMFYNNGKKFIPKDLSLLTPLAIAIWFMDDGSKTKESYTIATNSFLKEDVNRLREYLYNQYNIETTIQKSNAIYIKVNSQKIFTNLISPFIIESMQYKMHVPLKFCELSGKPIVK